MWSFLGAIFYWWLTLVLQNFSSCLIAILCNTTSVKISGDLNIPAEKDFNTLIIILSLPVLPPYIPPFLTHSTLCHWWEWLRYKPLHCSTSLLPLPLFNSQYSDSSLTPLLYIIYWSYFTWLLLPSSKCHFPNYLYYIPSSVIIITFLLPLNFLAPFSLHVLTCRNANLINTQCSDWSVPAQPNRTGENYTTSNSLLGTLNLQPLPSIEP